MRMLKIFLLAGVLSGCATVTHNPWQNLDTDPSAAVSAIDCGAFPYPSEVYKTHVVYDKAELNTLDDYKKCSEANEAIANEHALQIGQLKLARKGLTEAGAAQRSISDMKQEMLDDERKHNFFTSIGYWIVIIGMGAAL